MTIEAKIDALNQDGTPNSATNAAPRGSEFFFDTTGLSGLGTISVYAGNLQIPVDFAGAATGWPGIQQVNFNIPSSFGVGTTNLYVCGSTDGVTQNCSPPVPFTVK